MKPYVTMWSETDKVLLQFLTLDVLESGFSSGNKIRINKGKKQRSRDVCRIKLPANTEFLVKIASHFEQKKRKWKTIISTGLLMDKKNWEALSKNQSLWYNGCSNEKFTSWLWVFDERR
jgi:hypothetical protein